jgi:hypothetical protein
MSSSIFLSTSDLDSITSLAKYPFPPFSAPSYAIILVFKTSNGFPTINPVPPAKAPANNLLKHPISPLNQLKLIYSFY